MSRRRTEMNERLQKALFGRYTVLHDVGRGGMATVYQARDLRHDRDVAIKVLHPELGASLGVERFLSEIRTTANLGHPNILPLFDSGSADGLVFYVMPFIDGESLRERMTREKQMPIKDAVRIAQAVAAALEHANRRGVIHRDIKPENILLQDGQPLVADFGVALAVASAASSRITQSGYSVGTATYMSPEQAAAERHIDGRSDQYALASVLYEMLVGEPPFTGRTAPAVTMRLMSEVPTSVAVHRPSTPPYIVEAIRRALEKSPSERFPTTSDFASALNRPGTETFRVPVPVATPAAKSPWQMVHATITVLAIGAAVWLGVTRPSSTPAAPREETPATAPVAIGSATRFVLELPEGARVNQRVNRPLAISPDGRTIAYVADDADARIYLRHLNELAPTPLAGAARASTLSFSANGDSLRFLAGTTLTTMAIPARTPSTATAARAAAAAVTDEPREHVLGMIDEWVVLARNGTSITAAPVDKATGKLRGEPVSLVTDVSADPSGVPRAALSADGSLVYQDGGRTTAGAAPRLIVVQNWAAEVRERLRTAPK